MKTLINPNEYKVLRETRRFYFRTTKQHRAAWRGRRRARGGRGRQRAV